MFWYKNPHPFMGWDLKKIPTVSGGDYKKFMDGLGNKNPRPFMGRGLKSSEHVFGFYEQPMLVPQFKHL
jgi:hypothetical protein